VNRKETTLPIGFVELEHPTFEVFYNGRQFIIAFRHGEKAATIRMKEDFSEKLVEALQGAKRIYEELQKRRKEIESELVPSAGL